MNACSIVRRYIPAQHSKGSSMTSEIIAPLVAALGAISLATTTYWFTKKREREAELRKEKLEHYKDFVATLSGVISGESTDEGRRAFAKSCNKFNLIAPQVVIEALQAFQQEIKSSNATPGRSTHDKLMSKLFYEMRKDLGITPKDIDQRFTLGLWASGKPPKTAA